MKNKEQTIQHLNEVHEAAIWIGQELLRARIPVRDAKEKWGYVRVYCSFGYWNFHELVYPGHMFNRFPSWLISLDYHFLGTIIQHLYWIIEPIHKRWYRRTYKKAIEKWPHLRYDIIAQADFKELLEGL